MDEETRVLKDVFGESSESEIDTPQSQPAMNYSWERLDEINGLWICRGFIQPERQSSLLSAIEQEGWFTKASFNQAMRFGDLPEWAVELCGLIRDVVCLYDFIHEDNCVSTQNAKCKEEPTPLAPDLLWREPLFDQLIVNAYQPGEGICAHVDLMRFEDGIAIISLESSCVMHFTLVREPSSSSKNAYENVDEDAGVFRDMCVPFLLMPGDLVLMSGEARYLWKHEINRKPGFQMWKGQEIEQHRRISVTLRKLCQPR
ncbi:hypothetical protein AMTRI_Chr02g265420 [Amborella trichopoda]|uniref:Fe2OG dioxygenase domain-containing protein n=1 Tax=Amborella trichopoda TaxID=13333 RepID=W1P3J5_AMBTC|nr:alkylated DNA repair protein alkB homolog 8 [Amborella trichopoda]ERN02189.1 hypothetical protein AMTR_s00045p00203370 [Amborella trichopoda]|eukprot:XP_006840514.1 alkylated DNA repair protein alkB homolog 8 [Amborella trichopoda]